MFIKDAIDHISTSQRVFERVAKTDGALKGYLGSNLANISIAPGVPTVYVASINKSSSPDEYDEIKKACGPYKSLVGATTTPAATVVPASAPTAAPGFDRLA